MPPVEFVVDPPPVLAGLTQVTEFEVPVRNPLAESVRFGPVACDCACTGTTLPKPVLDPGEGMTVKVTVRTGERSGRQTFACGWGDQRGREWRAVVRTELCFPEQFDASRLSFGVLKPGRVATGSAVFKQHAVRAEELPPPPKLTSSDPSCEVSATPGPVREVRLGLIRRETNVTVSLTAPARAGYSTARVDPDRVRVPYLGGTSLLVEWTGEVNVTVSPARLVFLRSADRPQRRRVSLRAADGVVFAVTRASATGPGAAAEPVGGAGPVCLVDLVVNPEVSGNSLVGDLVVETTHPDALRVLVPYAVLGAPPAVGQPAP